VTQATLRRQGNARETRARENLLNGYQVFLRSDFESFLKLSANPVSHVTQD
jgi:predicted metal-dependent phosphoesterase TrpH